MNISRQKPLGKLLEKASLVIALSAAACSAPVQNTRFSVQEILIAGETAGDSQSANEKAYYSTNIQPPDADKQNNSAPSWNPLLGTPCFKGALKKMPPVGEACKYSCEEGRIAIKCKS